MKPQHSTEGRDIELHGFTRMSTSVDRMRKETRSPQTPHTCCGMPPLVNVPDGLGGMRRTM